MSSLFGSSIYNVSLVAFYQHKPPEFRSLINELQTYLSQTSILSEKFQSYSIEQIHGTIVGCEGFKTKQGIINKWFLENRQEIRYMDLEGLSQDWQKSDRFPLILRFGGYHPHLDYKFLSRSRHPFNRSFQLEISAEKTTMVTLIGWTYQQEHISFAIDNLRRHTQKFNCLHKYHYSPTTIDNDFYLCLGVIKTKLPSEEMRLVQDRVRNILQTKPPIYIPLTQKDLAFVRYQHPSLPLETTKIARIDELGRDKLSQWMEN